MEAVLGQVLLKLSNGDCDHAKYGPVAEMHDVFNEEEGFTFIAACQLTSFWLAGQPHSLRLCQPYRPRTIPPLSFVFVLGVHLA